MKQDRNLLYVALALLVMAATVMNGWEVISVAVLTGPGGWLTAGLLILLFIVGIILLALQWPAIKRGLFQKRRWKSGPNARWQEADESRSKGMTFDDMLKIEMLRALRGNRATVPTAAPKPADDEMMEF